MAVFIIKSVTSGKVSNGCCYVSNGCNVGYWRGKVSYWVKSLTRGLRELLRYTWHKACCDIGKWYKQDHCFSDVLFFDSYL